MTPPPPPIQNNMRNFKMMADKCSSTCLLSLSYIGFAVLNWKNKAEAQLGISSATLLKYIAFNRHEKFIRSYLDLTRKYSGAIKSPK
jgi:hypothetical protein